VSEQLIDLIYEAALVPERWAAVLDCLAVLSDSAGGALLATGDRHPPRWAASAIVADALRKFATGDGWKHNKRYLRYKAQKHPGFLRDADIFTPEELDRARTPRQDLTTNGLGWQLGTVIPMPSGEVVIYTLERRFERGPHDLKVVEAVDALYPHLARAGLLAARLGLERARTVVATLEAIGLPAAVLSPAGKAIAVNRLLEDMSFTLLPGAHDRIIIIDDAADSLFRAAAIAPSSERTPIVQSIPVPARDGNPAVIVHVLPLRGAAHDVFSGASTLIVVSTLGTTGNIPSVDLLRALFDLSPAEAKLAASLSSGRSLKDAAEDQKIKFSTARSYLEQVFLKTGTNQQSQLVALLKSTTPIAAPS
jgi:DNA-binding CsgD family transcriptional regulator